MKFTPAALLALALFVVLSEATNYKEAYCEGKTYVGNAENKKPHLHCGKDSMTLKLSSGKDTSFFDKKGARCSVLSYLDKSEWSGASDPKAITNAVNSFLEGECPHLFKFIRDPGLKVDNLHFANSDQSELYHRMLMRNNRLNQLLAKNAPDIVVSNEKRLLQESIKALLKSGGYDISKTPNRKYHVTGTGKIFHY